jgi:hypothetical protein
VPLIFALPSTAFLLRLQSGSRALDHHKKQQLVFSNGVGVVRGDGGACRAAAIFDLSLSLSLSFSSFFTVALLLCCSPSPFYYEKQ